LEPEIRRTLRGRFPELSADVPVTFRRLRHRGSHEIILARTATHPARDLIVKAPRRSRLRHEALRKRAEIEHHVLTEIAPRISAAHPSLRCPRVLAFDPGPPLLVLERVAGDSVKSLLFGRGRAPHRARIADVLQLSAQWLAALHEITRSEDERNVFDWVLAELAFPPTQRILSAYVGEATYRELLRLAARFRSVYPDVRRPLCRIHGAFFPHHVLASEDGIYVIDFESSRLGFPYEDLGAFTAWYELSVPWRRLVAQRRMDMNEQRALFWRAYSGTTGPATEPELIVRRFTRVLGMARFITLCLYGRSGEDLLAAAGSFADTTAAPLPARVPRRSMKSCLLEPWWRYRLRAVSHRELEALRDA